MFKKNFFKSQIPLLCYNVNYNDVDKVKHFEGGEIMKKIVLAIIATSMLLTNVAFASTVSTKTTYANTSKNSTVSNVKQNSVYHLNTQDPY